MEPRIQPNIPDMMQKLDELYAKEETIMKDIMRLQGMLDQLQEDKEMIQNLIMYQSNKNSRQRYGK